MVRAISPGAGQPCGIQHVCRLWDVPRSSFSAARNAAQDTTTSRPTSRRGPKPIVPDGDLLAAIRADIAGSPWSGEG
jgi:hypothetical protein